MHSCRRRQGGEGESSVWSKVFLRQMQQGLLPLRGHGEGDVAREMLCAGGSEVNVEGATRSVVLIHDENIVELDVPVRHTEFVQVGGYLENRSGELKSAVGVKTIEVEDIASVGGNAARVGKPHRAHSESLIHGRAAAGSTARMAETNQHA